MEKTCLCRSFSFSSFKISHGLVWCDPDFMI